MKAKIIIAFYRTLKSNGIKAEIDFRDYGEYAALKLKFGKKGQQPTIWSRLYKSQRLIKMLEGIPYNYILFKKQ